MARIMLAMPIYKGQMEAAVLPAVAVNSTRKHAIGISQSNSSANCGAMNLLWVKALEEYEAGLLDYFLMLHSDIVVESSGWIDTLVDIMTRTGADIVSAVSPIKDLLGITSTALDEPMSDHPPQYRVRRLSMAEIMRREPTFTDPKLLLNDGVMLVDLSKAWCDKVHFHFDDTILWHHGKRMTFCAPEDWNFSRDARANGAKLLYATREIRLRHIGEMAFENGHVWGTMATDQDDPAWPMWKHEAVKQAQGVPGYMQYEELAWLAEQARDKKSIVEIGSWKGRSTKALALAQEDGKVYAVDHWRGNPGGDATGVEAEARGGAAIRGEFTGHLLPEIERGRVWPIQADHARLVETLEACGGFAGADMVFIDGDHAYEAVARDIRSALAIVKPGGLIAGHDLNEPGVAKAVQEAFGPDRWTRGNGSIWAYEHKSIPVPV